MANLNYYSSWQDNHFNNFYATVPGLVGDWMKWVRGLLQKRYLLWVVFMLTLGSITFTFHLSLCQTTPPEVQRVTLLLLLLMYCVATQGQSRCWFSATVTTLYMWLKDSLGRCLRRIVGWDTTTSLCQVAVCVTMQEASKNNCHVVTAYSSHATIGS